MPTYEYRCVDCNYQFERFQKMSDDPVTECDSCGGEVQRVLFPVAIHFKGSGFYTTDYAKKSTLCPSNGNGGGASESAPSDSGKSETVASKDASSKESAAKAPVSNG